MRLAFDARCRERPLSSFARTLGLLEDAARITGLEFGEWREGSCHADLIWSPQLEPPPVRGVRMVLTLHDVNPLLDDGRPLLAHLRREVVFRRKVRLALRRAWRLVTDSDDARRRIRAQVRHAADRISVVPLYAAAPMQPGPPAEQALARLGLQPGYLLYLAALRRHKNWERLLAAYALLPAALRRVHPLVLAGDPRRARRRLDALLEELVLGEQVRVLGTVADELLPDLYRGAALFVFPSLMEGFGLPPLEAMACGVPVAASNRTSLPEVLGDAARYFEPTDPQAIAATVQEVLTNAELRLRLREAGLAQAARYGPERTGQAMRSVLDRAAVES